MKQITLTICAAALLLFACNDKKKTDEGKTETSSAETKTAEKTETAPPMDSAAMMKAWQDFMTPGPMHQWMAKQAGTWEAEMSQWMDPAAPPEKVMAKEVCAMTMNGLYLTSNMTSTMMGQPMMGQSTLGYDNAKKMFVSTWIDNLGSGIIYMTGTYDEATKTMSMKGKQTDPTTGKDSDIRQEMKWIDDNSYTMSMYGAGMDGKEMKFMEGTFKRK
jgi:hypothetical protein